MIRSLHRPLRQSGSVVTVATRCASLSFSFIPTGSIHDFELELFSHQENESAIPDPPDFSNHPRLYSDIVSPADVCDLVLRPTFEDVAVTSLATGCPVSGKPTYQVVSTSSISNTNLLFAGVASSWLSQLSLEIYDLSALPKNDHTLSYANQSKSKLIANQFNQQVLESYENIESFYNFFVNMPESTITIEDVTRHLLEHSGTESYKLVTQYLAKNVHLLNPFVLNEFVAILLEDLSASPSVEKVELFDSFVNDSLVASVPNLLQDLPPSTLDQLAYITASASSLKTSAKALTLLCRNHRLAPALPTFELYMSRYCKLATQQQFSKEQVLRDLAPMKPIIFHYGLTPSSLKLILATVADNSYDLSHIVRLVQDRNATLLNDHGSEIMNKLREIQTTSSDSPMIKAVQAANLARAIITSTLASPQLEKEVSNILSEWNLCIVANAE